MHDLDTKIGPPKGGGTVGTEPAGYSEVRSGKFIGWFRGCNRWRWRGTINVGHQVRFCSTESVLRC